MEDFNSWKEKLKENSNIVNVISKYVPLNRKGKTWWANCPFHYEKTPSFAVNEMEQFYKCFGCGVSGDVFGFVQKIEACDFMEACEILAKDANMKMPVFQENEAINKLKQEKDLAYKILKDATLYYMHNLVGEQGKPGQAYITKRKLTPETVKQFAIGYSLGWNEVVDYLAKKGYTVAEMKMAGVVDEKDGKPYDAYAKRLIFPIINSNNDVVGFSARILEDANFAKYKNTAQTVVFNKSRVLYGINNIKKTKQTEPLHEIIIVEGQIDLISIYQAGIKNAVATMGTALTQLHAKELKRYCDKIVLCFDGDSAGKKATLHSIDILNAEGLQVYVSRIPNNADPDDYVNQFGKDAFIDIIKTGKYWVEFLITDLASQFNFTVPNERKEFIAQALQVVKKLESNSEQMVYLELIKKLSNISVDVLKRDLENLNSAKPTDKVQEEQQVGLNNENAYVKAVKFVLSALLFKKEYAYLPENLEENLKNNDYKKIYRYIVSAYKENKKPVVSSLFDMFDVEHNPDVKAIVEYEFNTGNDSETYFKDCLKTVVKTSLEQLQQELTQKMKENITIDEKKEIAKQLSRVLEDIRKLR